MILFSQLSFIFHFPCSHFQVTNIPSSEQSTTPFPSIYCLILYSFALNAYTCETNWKESLVQTLLHLSKLWPPQVWFSCLLPPNQRLLGQQHDKLSIRKENSMNYLGPNNGCWSKSQDLWSSAYLALLVEHASGDETPATMCRWALDLCSRLTEAAWTNLSISQWQVALYLYYRWKGGNLLTTYSNQSSALTGLWNQILQNNATSNTKNKQNFAEVMMIGITIDIIVQ